jgi:hypothetical protein
MKNIFIFLCVLISFYSALGQERKVENYKYIIVPNKLDFFNEIDQYQTSSLLQFLLHKNGFTVILDSEQYPLELRADLCKALTANIIKEASLFKTSIHLELKDCFNQVVYTSNEGTSRLKDYKKSYQAAMRNLHSTMGAVTYKPKITAERLIISKDAGIDSIESKDTRTILSPQIKENGYQLLNADAKIIFEVLNTSLPNIFVVKDRNGILYKKGAYWLLEYFEGDKRIIEQFTIHFVEEDH